MACPLCYWSQRRGHPRTKFKVEIRFRARWLDVQTSLQFDARAEKSSRDEQWCVSLKAALSQYREDSASESWIQSWSQFTPLTPFLAISWLNGRFGSWWSEATTHFMDQVDAVGPSPDVLVKLHGEDAGLPSIWRIETSLLLAAIRHLVSNREMLVVTEISHRLGHQFVIALDRSRSKAVHDANHLIQRIEDSRRLSFLLA